jgi:hypothetical protein
MRATKGDVRRTLNPFWAHSHDSHDSFPFVVENPFHLKFVEHLLIIVVCFVARLIKSVAHLDLLSFVLLSFKFCLFKFWF